MVEPHLDWLLLEILNGLLYSNHTIAVQQSVQVLYDLLYDFLYDCCMIFDRE